MKKLDVSFAGCGFLVMYHVGVLKFIQNHASNSVKINRALGASAGAVVACLSLIEYPSHLMREKFHKITGFARQHSVVGAFHPRFKVQQILKDELLPELPINITDTVNDRLFISLTELNGKNRIVSNFRSREDLVDALACSCHLPAFSGYRIPTFRGKRFIDGGLSVNLPTLDKETLMVSPFSGTNKDICPVDKIQYPSVHLQGETISLSPENLKRGIHVVKAVKPQVYDAYYSNGFKDAQRCFNDPVSKFRR